jgi:hypothetical protein
MFTTTSLRPAQSHNAARRRGALFLAAAAVTAAAAVATSVPASAGNGHGGGRAVRASNPCATGIIKLKAKHDDALIDAGVEVDTNVAGQVWTVSFLDNGVTVWQGTGTTDAVSGAFGMAHPLADQAAADVIMVQAVMGTTVCSAQVTV